jgi:hypothetical protein
MACHEHPHRSIAGHYDHCRRGYCGECLVRGGPQLPCRDCAASAPARAAAAAAARRPTTRLLLAWREHRASLVATGCIGGVLALLAVSIGLASLSPAYRAEMAEPVERAAAALQVSGSLTTDGDPRRARGRPGGAAPVAGGAPQASSGQGRFAGAVVGVVAADGSSGGTYGAIALLRDPRGGFSGWRSQTDTLPLDLHFQLRERVVLDRVVFWHTQVSPPAAWAKEVEVLLEVSDATGQAAGWRSVGRWTLRQSVDGQAFAFQPAGAQAVVVRVHSRHGDAAYSALGAFAAGVQGQGVLPGG